MCEMVVYDLDDFIDEDEVVFESGIHWSTNPPNMGDFGDDNTLLTTFEPFNVGVITPFELILEATGEGECNNQTVLDSISVSIEPLPNVYAGADKIICVNAPVQLEDATVDYASSILWEAKKGSFDNDTILNPVYYPYQTMPGILDTIVISAFGFNSCANESARDTLYIFPNPIPNAGFVYEDTCTALIKFYDISAPSAIINSWEWDFGDGTGSSLQNPSNIYQYTDSCYNVQLIVTDLNGCIDTINQEVCVDPELSIDFTFDTICHGDTTHFYGIIKEPENAQINEWYWEFGDGQTGYGDTTWHIYSNPDTYYVSLTATDDNNCESTVYYPVIVNELPDVDFSYVLSETDLSVYFYDATIPNANGITNWKWYFGDGVSSTFQNPTHPYDNPGTYEVTLIVTNSNGCTSEVTKTVIRLPLIISSFEVTSQPLCTDHVIQFADNSMYADQIESWEWDFGDGPPLIYNYYQNTISHVYSSSGSYTVCLIVKMTLNQEVISDTSCQNVVVLSSPEADFSYPTTCLGATTQFKDSSNNNNIPISLWRWDFDNGDTASIQNPQYLFDTAGIYNVELIVENTIGCRDTIEQAVRVFALPIVNFSYTNPCVTQYTYFEDESTGDGSEINFWQWLIENEQGFDTAYTETIQYIFNSTGDYTVNLFVSDENGCSNSEDFEIEVFTIPISDFSMIYNYDGLQGQVKFENQSTGADYYFWDFGDTYTSSLKNPVYTYMVNGEYLIELVSYTESCSDTSTKVYELIFTGLYIPNAFSPEDPDPNVSLFKPSGVGLKEYRIEIFDIWGTMIWYSDKLDTFGQPVEGWDGTYKGSPMSSGVYVWKASGIFINKTIWKGSDIGDGKSPQTQGSLLLIR